MQYLYSKCELYRTDMKKIIGKHMFFFKYCVGNAVIAFDMFLKMVSLKVRPTCLYPLILNSRFDH